MRVSFFISTTRGQLLQVVYELLSPEVRVGKRKVAFQSLFASIILSLVKLVVELVQRVDLQHHVAVVVAAAALQGGRGRAVATVEEIALKRFQIDFFGCLLL